MPAAPAPLPGRHVRGLWPPPALSPGSFGLCSEACCAHIWAHIWLPSRPPPPPAFSAPPLSFLRPGPVPRSSEGEHDGLCGDRRGRPRSLGCSQERQTPAAFRPMELSKRRLGQGIAFRRGWIQALEHPGLPGFLLGGQAASCPHSCLPPGGWSLSWVLQRFHMESLSHLQGGLPPVPGVKEWGQAGDRGTFPNGQPSLGGRWGLGVAADPAGSIKGTRTHVRTAPGSHSGAWAQRPPAGPWVTRHQGDGGPLGRSPAQPPAAPAAGHLAPGGVGPGTEPPGPRPAAEQTWQQLRLDWKHVAFILWNSMRLAHEAVPGCSQGSTVPLGLLCPVVLPQKAPPCRENQQGPERDSSLCVHTQQTRYPLPLRKAWVSSGGLPPQGLAALLLVPRVGLSECEEARHCSPGPRTDGTSNS